MEQQTNRMSYQQKLEQYYHGLAKREREGRFDAAANRAIENFLVELRQLAACETRAPLSKAA